MVLRKIKKMYFIRYFTVSYHALPVNQNITKNDRYRKKIRTQKRLPFRILKTTVSQEILYKYVICGWVLPARQ